MSRAIRFILLKFIFDRIETPFMRPSGMWWFSLMSIIALINILQLFGEFDYVAKS